jgi:TetR/AcrR family transcriptional regulator, repressor of fatR-cypB operon
MEPLNGEQALSRKEREKNARQHDILKAARDLFIRKGYHETTLDDIASLAEFGKGTIYNYFSSKEELFYGIIDQASNEAFDSLTSAISVAGTARDKLTAYARAIIIHAHENADLFRLIFLELYRSGTPEYKNKIKHFQERGKDILELVERPITEEIRKGTIKPFDAHELVSIFDSTLRGYCLNFIENKFQSQIDTVDATASLIVSIFFDGVTKPNSKG